MQNNTLWAYIFRKYHNCQFFQYFCQFRAQKCEILKVFHTKNACYKNAHWTLFLEYFSWKWRISLKINSRIIHIHLFKSYLYIQAGSDSIGNRSNHRNSFVWYWDTRHRSLTLGNLKRTLFDVYWKFGLFFIRISNRSWYP